jgi:hypothetical protein
MTLNETGSASDEQLIEQTEEKAEQALIPKSTPQSTELVKVADRMHTSALAYVIDCPEMYDLAAEEYGAIVKKAKELNEQRMGITRLMDEAKKRVVEVYRPALERLDQAKTALSGLMLDYTKEQERLAKIETDKAEALAKIERDRLMEEAAKAEESGDVEMAVVHAATAEMVVAQAPVYTAPKAAGVSSTTKWSAEITDKAALLRYILDTENPMVDLEAITINMPALNKLAVALKDKMKLPGVKAVSKAGLSAR